MLRVALRLIRRKTTPVSTLSQFVSYLASKSSANALPDQRASAASNETRHELAQLEAESLHSPTVEALEALDDAPTTTTTDATTTITTTTATSSTTTTNSHADADVAASTTESRETARQSPHSATGARRASRAALLSTAKSPRSLLSVSRALNFDGEPSEFADALDDADALGTNDTGDNDGDDDDYNSDSASDEDAAEGAVHSEPNELANSALSMSSAESHSHDRRHRHRRRHHHRRSEAIVNAALPTTATTTTTIDPLCQPVGSPASWLVPPSHLGASSRRRRSFVIVGAATDCAQLVVDNSAVAVTSLPLVPPVIPLALDSLSFSF